ncbi:hypothetical protein BJ508DRAFT_410177 [Ascobolus immersus RN42]|uniref:Uncharacterized protein n=1 Tax=Ascobolus immersus RN42 TaxID=1160509 RepID=A0A3N4IMP7_ASCIM|nr:hypothetical protein BJ508DRAFT_410177 [Ascobolus immersus RN42]
MVLLSLYQPDDSESISLPIAKTILYTHVLHRGLTMGTIIGALVHPALYPLRKRQATSQTLPKTNIIPHAFPSFKTYLFSPALFSTMAKTTYVMTAVIGVATTGMMWGKEPIEWQDRAYRLCWNEGQNRVDKGSLAGIAAGVVVGGMKGLRGHALLGAGGVGSVVGVLGAVAVGKLM